MALASGIIHNFSRANHTGFADKIVFAGVLDIILFEKKNLAQSRRVAEGAEKAEQRKDYLVKKNSFAWC
jgi:hypothetical protein